MIAQTFNGVISSAISTNIISKIIFVKKAPQTQAQQTSKNFKKVLKHEDLHKHYSDLNPKLLQTIETILLFVL